MGLGFRFEFRDIILSFNDVTVFHAFKSHNAMRASCVALLWLLDATRQAPIELAAEELTEHASSLRDEAQLQRQESPAQSTKASTIDLRSVS